MSMNLNKKAIESRIILDAMSAPGGKNGLVANFDGAKYFVKDSREAREVMMAMDADWNTASSGIPQAATTIWSQEPIEQIVQNYAFKDVAAPYQYGSFETTNLTLPTIAYSGNTQPYADHSKSGTSNANVNFPNRDVYRMEAWVEYGELAAATWSAAKLDYIGSQRKAASIAIAQTINDIGFNGYAGQKTYGVLTDPGLNAQITLAASAANSSSSKWIYKTPVEMSADIQAMFNSIVAKCMNNVNLMNNSGTPMTLMLTPVDMTYISTMTVYGTQTTLAVWLKTIFSGLNIVSAPQYQVGDGTAGNLGQLIVHEIAGQKVLMNTYTYLLRAHTLEAYSSYQQQKMSSGTGGAVVTLPMGMCTASGF